MPSCERRIGSSLRLLLRRRKPRRVDPMLACESEMLPPSPGTLEYLACRKI